MTRTPHDPELVATGKILALFGTLTEGGRRRALDLIRERFGQPAVAAVTSSGLPPARNLPPATSGTPRQVDVEPRVSRPGPDWGSDLAPPAGT